MNKRLVWNFEINPYPPIKLPSLLSAPHKKTRWEARFFWPESSIPCLNGLNDSFLLLSNYEIKHRSDLYYLLMDEPLNIKNRDDKLLFKPILERKERALAYGKKIELNAGVPQPIAGLSSKTIDELLSKIKKHAQKIEIEKEALIYTFLCQPKIKLELARLRIKNTHYLSLCIESKAEVWVDYLSHHLVQNEVQTDYVRFLQSIIFASPLC